MDEAYWPLLGGFATLAFGLGLIVKEIFYPRDNA